ncbi:MAG TPA: thioredoxin domain-containing protein [Pseudonocardia sp.]
MGGASRNERKRRQEAAAQRLASAGIQVPQRANNTSLIIVVAVVVAAVLAGGVVLYLRNAGTVATVTPAYAATSSGAVVTAGSGKPTIDVYEDFLCPNCEIFEKAYGNEIVSALNDGKLTVRFHSIAILDKRSSPAGYSTRAANAALCAVPAGTYPAYHQKLFASQPSEGSAGLTDDQLVEFGSQLGAKGDFAGCVKGAKNAAAVTAETQKAVANPAAQTNGVFGTPTVIANGTQVNLNNTNWLKDILAAG